MFQNPHYVQIAACKDDRYFVTNELFIQENVIYARKILFLYIAQIKNLQFTATIAGGVKNGIPWIMVRILILISLFFRSLKN